MFLYALAGLQAVSALKQADEIRRSADLTRKLNEINAQYADYDAYQAELGGETQAARYQSEIDKIASEQQTTLAAQGVDINYGTAAEIQKDTKVTGFLNILDIKQQARARAMGFKREARETRIKGAFNQSQAEINANGVAVAGLLNAGATGYRGWSQTSPDGLKTDVLGKSNKTAENRDLSSMSYWGRTS